MTDSGNEDTRSDHGAGVGRLGVWRQFRHCDTSNDVCPCCNSGTDDRGTDDRSADDRSADDRSADDRSADDGGTHNDRSADDDRGTNDYCNPVYHDGSTYHHSGAGNDNCSSPYDCRPNHDHPVRSSVRRWRPSC